MANDTIFMRSAVNERTLLETLERITGLVCCSLEFPEDSAQAVLVPIEYSEGFRFAPSLTWHASLHLAVSFDEIAQLLAKEFDVDVRFQAQDSISDTEQEKWQLALPTDDSPRVVRITQLSDGICLATDTSIL